MGAFFCKKKLNLGFHDIKNTRLQNLNSLMSIIGLDFGTSNTVATVYNNGKSTMVPLEDENASLPSSIFFPFSDLEKPIYGNIATEAYVKNGYGRYLKSFKRVLGTPFYTQGTLLKPGYKIQFHKLIVDYLKYVKEKVEIFIQNDIDYAIIGKPVRFSQDQDSQNSGVAQLELILKDVGFKDYSFLEEPIAAAYFHINKVTINSKAIIADLGGGTCDFTIVERNNLESEFEILSTSGVSLGGTDIDSNFALNIFYPDLGYKSLDKYKGLPLPDKPYRYASDWNLITNLLYTPKIEMLVKKMVNNSQEKEKLNQFQKIVSDKQAHSLLGQIENTKIELSNKNNLTFKSHLMPNSSGLAVSRDDLNNSIKHITDKIIKASDECCELASVNNDSIDYLILTGGTSKLPLLKELFTLKFPNAKVISDNSMDAVSKGLLTKAIKNKSH